MGEVVGSTWHFIAYMVFSLLISLFLAHKTDKRAFAFFLFLWLFSAPVAAVVIPGKLGFLPFDMTPNRYLLLMCLMLLATRFLQGVKSPVIRDKRYKAGFEKYILIYAVLVFIAVVKNMNYLPTKWLIAIPLEPIIFAVLYFTMKNEITKRLLDVLLAAIVIFAVINSLVCIIQLFVDPHFIRIEKATGAFGSYYRSYGIFRSEYILGAVQVSALFVAWVIYRNRPILKVITPLLLFSVFTTFHRLDLIVVVLCMMIYLTTYNANKRVIMPFLALILTVIVVLPIYSIYTSSGGKSQLIEDRLKSDTVSGRLKQYGVVIKALPQYPLGLGNYTNSIYQDLMIKNGIAKSIVDSYGRQTFEALGVHNGFLGVAIQYGIMAMLVFATLLYKMFKYFHVLYKSTQERLYVIPIFTVLVWFFVNTSNGIIAFRDHNVLMIALVLGAFVGAAQKGIIGQAQPGVRT